MLQILVLIEFFEASSLGEGKRSPKISGTVARNSAARDKKKCRIADNHGKSIHSPELGEGQKTH